MPIAKKAIKRAKERDEPIAGKNTNPFTILNNAPDHELKTSLDQLGIISDNLDLQISAFKAEELVRADLARANYKIYIDKRSSENSPQGHEEIRDLSMEFLDNKARDIDPVLGLTSPDGGRSTHSNCNQ